MKKNGHRLVIRFSLFMNVKVYMYIHCLSQNEQHLPGVMAHTFNASTWEVEIGTCL